MKNPYEKAREQKRITKLLKENAELKAESKRLASEAGAHRTTADVLYSLIISKKEYTAELEARVLWFQSKIETAINTLKNEDSNRNEENATR